MRFLFINVNDILKINLAKTKPAVAGFSFPSRGILKA
jgi:hypothetical protein